MMQFWTAALDSMAISAGYAIMVLGDNDFSLPDVSEGKIDHNTLHSNKSTTHFISKGTVRRASDATNDSTRGPLDHLLSAVKWCHNLQPCLKARRVPAS